MEEYQTEEFNGVLKDLTCKLPELAKGISVLWPIKEASINKIKCAKQFIYFLTSQNKVSF